MQAIPFMVSRTHQFYVSTSFHLLHRDTLSHMQVLWLFPKKPFWIGKVSKFLYVTMYVEFKVDALTPRQKSTLLWTTLCWTPFLEGGWICSVSLWIFVPWTNNSQVTRTFTTINQLRIICINIGYHNTPLCALSANFLSDSVYKLASLASQTHITDTFHTHTKPHFTMVNPHSHQ